MDDHTFSYTGKPQWLMWKIFALKMQLPKSVLSADVKECKLRVKVSPSGPFQFPEGTELVSGLYYINFVNCSLEHIKVEVQHCAKQGDLQNSLTFTECTQEDPLQSAHMEQFKILGGRKFHDQYGGIELSNSCIVGIAYNWHSTSMPAHRAYQSKWSRKYFAKLDCSNIGNHIWDAHFVITWMLDVLLSVSIR